MSIIHISQISTKINALFSDSIDTTDLSDKDPEKDTKVLTRCLAAYAVYFFLGCSIKDAANSIIDGGDDNGIDAILYSPSLKEMVIVQSKWKKSGKGEPDSGEIGKFCRGIKDLFNLNFDRFNQKLQNKRTIIEQALNEFDTRYKIVLIDTGNTSLAKHSQRQIDDIIDELNDSGEDNAEKLVSFNRFNQGKIHSSLAQNVGLSPIDLEVGLTQWGKINDPHRAYFGMISAEEIAHSWKKYGRRLFEKNIRQVLGNTDVNEEIKSSLIHSPENFWYYNNGITIVAEKIEKSMIGGTSRENGIFKLSGAQIVNGAQTVSTIGKFDELNPDSLSNAWVSVRLISLADTPEGFGGQVTKANNRQNKIENRDFVSQDPEQIRIKTELSIDGIDYNIVRSETFKASEKSFDLQEATSALACCTGKSNMAVQAKREIGKFYEDLTKGIYKEIFNPSINGVYIWNCVHIARIIDARLLLEKFELSKKSGRYYGLLVHGNKIISLLVIKKLSLRDQAEKVDFKLDYDLIFETIDAYVESVFKYLEENYPDSIIGTLFKNATKCREIVKILS